MKTPGVAMSVSGTWQTLPSLLQMAVHWEEAGALKADRDVGE